jgi:hypothetical protein
MIGAHDVGVNGCVLDGVDQSVGYHEIVDAPTGVVRPGIEHIAPPGVGSGHFGV